MPINNSVENQLPMWISTHIFLVLHIKPVGFPQYSGNTDCLEIRELQIKK